MIPTVYVYGLKEFQAALRLAGREGPPRLRKALLKAGQPALARTEALARRTRRSGTLAGGYRLRATQKVGSIESDVPYAAGAEWGTKGKWAGFRSRYPGPEAWDRGSFIWRAIGETQDEIGRIIDAELREILTIYGWGHESG